MEKPVQQELERRFTRAASRLKKIGAGRMKEKTLAEKVLRYTIRHTKLIAFGIEPQR